MMRSHDFEPEPDRAFRNASDDEGVLGYTGAAGSFCIMASSNLDAIPVGSKVVYTEAATAAGGLNTDIVISAQGGDTAFGHVVLDGANQIGKESPPLHNESAERTSTDSHTTAGDATTEKHSHLSSDVKGTCRLDLARPATDANAQRSAPGFESPRISAPVSSLSPESGGAKKTATR